LVFNHEYAGIVKTWEIVGLMKLHNIRVLNRANCWNFQGDKRNLDMLVVIKTVCGHDKPFVLRSFDYFS